MNNFVGFEVVGTGSGTINQYLLGISGITSIIMGGGGFCYNETVNDGQNIYILLRSKQMARSVLLISTIMHSRSNMLVILVLVILGLRKSLLLLMLVLLV